MLQPETTSDLVTVWLNLRVQAWTAVVGALFFGAMIGNLVRRVVSDTNRLDVVALGGIVSVIAGGAITSLFSQSGMLFGAYSIGLGFAYLFTRAPSHRRTETGTDIAPPA